MCNKLQKRNCKELIKCLFRRWISSSSDITCPPHQQDIYEKQVGYKEERTVGGEDSRRIGQ